MLGSVLGGILIVSGIAVLALLRFVKLESQRRVLMLAAAIDIVVGLVAVGLGMTGVLR